MSINKYNIEGYDDPTAYAALTNIEIEERKAKFRPVVYVCSPFSADPVGNAEQARRYWKPTLLWVIDRVRVMNPIQMEVKGIRPIKYTGGNDLSYYTYLKQCRYQVQAHFEWNMNRPELAGDRNENKHHEMAKRMIRRGGRRDIFLGTRECQGYVEPCTFGEGAGAFDDLPELALGLMYHGITYADESYDDATRGYLTVNFWRPVMRYGVIEFPRPEDCPLHKRVRPMGMRSFSREQNNFSGLEECSPQGGQAEWD